MQILSGLFVACLFVETRCVKKSHVFRLCSVVAAFGSGVAYSLVSAGLQGQPMNAITTAAGFAVFQGVFFKVSDHIYK